MTTPISEVITINLQDQPPTVEADNPNAVMLITDDTGGSTLSSLNRYEVYSTIEGVVNDFGSLSAVASHARTFFEQSPNPLDAGGSLIIGFHRSSDEQVPATAATLEGGSLDTLLVVGELREVTDGSFAITIDGGTETEVTGLDFSGASNLEDIANTIDGSLTGASAVAGTDSITITSDTTGSASDLTYLTEASTGTFIGEVLKLTDGSGATLEPGADQETLTAGTKVETLDALKSEVGFRGFVFIPAVTDSEVPDIASWVQSNTVLSYDVRTGSDAFNVDSGNPVYNVAQAGQTNYRMIHRKDGDRKAATAYMSRNHTVNFNADNSAQTMHLKTLNGITPESYTGTELQNADTVGLDLYVSTKGRPWVRTSSGNDYADNRYNLIAYVDALETDLFNFLGSAGTKVLQTDQGVQSLVDRGERTTRRFKRANVFAPGEWLRPDYFGDRETFFRNIREFGYYWLAGSVADQPQSERDNRVSPVLQVAVKNAGAIHAADVIVQFNA